MCRFVIDAPVDSGASITNWRIVGKG